MFSVGTTYDTPYSTFERMTKDLVIIRYKRGVVVDHAGLDSSVTTARSLFKGAVPFAAMVLFPEHVEFDMDALQNDHYAGVDPGELMRVMAVVPGDPLFRRIAELYFAHFPVEMNVMVFDHLQNAIIWVDERINERDSTARSERRT